MKRNLFLGVLIIEAILCILFHVLQNFTGVSASIAAFPFEQTGFGLRTLSLSGTAGNAAAVVIYIAVSLLPAAILLILWKKRGLFPEDWLLLLLCAALFVVLYLMINPGVTGFPVSGQPVLKAVLGGAVYSVICGYFVLRVLRLFFRSDANRLAGYMSVMLGVLAVLFVYLAFGSRLGELLDSLAELRAANTEGSLFASYFILDFGYLTDIIPYVLNVSVVMSSLSLLRELRRDRYSEETVTAAKRLSYLCAVSLSAAVFLSIAYNLIQVIIINSLRTVNISVRIPVFSLAFVLSALLLTRLVADNKSLKDDNDLFI